MEFNYQKAYCTQAAPAFNKLPKHVKAAHAALLPLVGELSQGHNLAIPLNDAIRVVLEPLTTKEIAEMSRASHAVGHWHPSLLPRLFNMAKGESWKVTNCCDQVLRERLGTTHKIEIHDGKLRVTFSSRDCWLWEEFGLATDENLKTFKGCGLRFGEETLHESAKQLAAVINDLWEDVDRKKDNALYKKFLKLQQEKQEEDIKKAFDKKIQNLKQSQINAQKEVEFLLMCNGLQLPVDNVIYYAHTDTFCFGWRTPLSSEENEAISSKLGPASSTYNIEYK